MSELDNARLLINETDKKIAELFEKRMDAVKIVADYKKEHGIKVDDFAREEQIIAKNSSLIENEDYRPYYVSFLRSAIDVSKKYQHRLLDGMKIAFSGSEGAFAQIIAKRIFPDGETLPHKDFKAAYKSVVNGECDCAVLPVENSVGGDVGSVLDLAFFGSLSINGIYEAEIVQNLLSNEGASLENIKEVISHPQALGQCAEFIAKHGFKMTDCVNTAVAASTVAKSKRTDIAAIASLEAAEKTGLKVLCPHINDVASNTTRFAVFSRSAKAPAKTDKHFAMMFTVKNVAGSLGKAISVIGANGFNLKALKSRPTKELVWDYYFYAEGEGNINSKKGEKCLKELKSCCDNLKILGSFEKEVRV